MKTTNKPIFFTRIHRFVFALFLFGGLSATWAQQTPNEAVQDSVKTGHSLGRIELKNPNSIVQKYTYDPLLDKYVYTETVGEFDIKYPLILSPEQYQDLILKESMKGYFKEKIDAISGRKDGTEEARKNLLPEFYINSSFFETIFGGNTIEVIPQGSVAMDLGIRYQKNDNPSLSPRNRSNISFDFDQRISLSLLGKVGERLRVTANYDTQSTFNFQNLIKLEYAPTEDDIIRKIEVGNVSMPINSSLINGAQSLFGVKTELQFGRTRITGVFSEQRSQTQSVTAQGGGTLQEFQLFALDYDEDRHFFLSQYFRDTYNNNISSYPYINSPIQITRIEVYVTNRTARTNNVRNVVAIQDLGESNPEKTTYDDQVATFFNTADPNAFPDNSNNNFDPTEIGNAGNILSEAIRDIATVQSGFTQGTAQEGFDYAVMESARKLEPNEYQLNTQLGYISLNQRLSNDEVIAVAFQYTAGGQVFQVGEFANDGVNSTDVELDVNGQVIEVNNQSLVLKMLKSSVTNVDQPVWDLMMKNIYSTGAFQLNREDFSMNILYSDPSPINYITPVSGTNFPDPDLQETILLNVFRLDKLNIYNDPQEGGDGFFDYLPGITVDEQYGRIIFTTVEPFGEFLFETLDNTPGVGPENYNDPSTYNPNQAKYVYRDLYDKTKAAAFESSEQNKFQLKGRYKSSGAGDGIPIGAFNVPRGSVRVTAGGRVLQEGVDYTVNYQIGRVQILDEALKASNTPIEVSVENNSVFGQQNKRFTGLDIEHQFNDNFIIGATVLNLNERPLTQKANYGVEPVNNTMLGFRGNYSTEVPFLTRMVNKLPNIDTDAPSNVSVRGEFAYLAAGASKNSEFQGEATSYVDDFEGSQTNIDMKGVLAWSLSSVPEEVPGGDLPNDDLGSGFNRAKLAWYTIDPIFYSSQRPGDVSDDDISLNETRRIFINEIFPQQNLVQGQNTVQTTLDLAYYPEERGPYNYTNQNTTANLNEIPNPSQNWGGITRAITSTNFEQANVEFIQFWLLDTFTDSTAPGTDLGELVFNLGNISEDVLKDGRKQYENGLPTPTSNDFVTETNWASVPSAQSLVYAFDADETNREAQDVGFDGLSDAFEDGSDPTPGTPPDIDATAFALKQRYSGLEDPALDNYRFYLAADGTILERYRDYNGTDGNSPVIVGDTNRGATTLPDTEDINRDQTMNTINNYLGYRIPIRKNMRPENHPFVTDIRILSNVEVPNNDVIPEVRWIQFKIPVTPGFYENPTFAPFFENPDNISDLRSVRFMRMYLTGFDQPVVMRFGTLDLIRGDWRRYTQSLDQEADNSGDPNTTVDVSAVNILENENRSPINYVLPPGLQREQLNNNNTIVNLNEQSLAFRVRDLEVDDARGVFKNVDVDMRQYKQIKMFMHAERLQDEPDITDGDLIGFLRIGTDLNENYYQIEVPLSPTPYVIGQSNRLSAEQVWPDQNSIDLSLDVLSRIKSEALTSGALTTDALFFDVNGEELTFVGDVLTANVTPIAGRHRVAISGNPTLGSIRNMMIGIKNGTNRDVDGEVWFNELRLAELDQQGGWAAVGALDANLADFASVSATGSISTIGFGSIDQVPNARAREDAQEYALNTNVNLGQLLPKKWGIQVPFNYSISEELITPEFDPFFQDLKLQDQIDAADTQQDKDSIRNTAIDYTKRRSVNFIGVRKNRGAEQEQRFYDIENFDFSYSYNETNRHNYEIAEFIDQQVRVGANYGYSFKPKYFEPFKNMKFLSEKKYLTWLKDLNLNLLPSNISLTSNINRSFNEQTFRDVGLPQGSIVPTLQQRNFLFDWSYAITHNFTRSLRMNFTASNNFIVKNYFEDDGTINRDLGLWDGFWDTGDPNRHSTALNVTYDLPFSKIPGLGFVTSSYNYTGNFAWTRGSDALQDVRDENGNTLGIVNRVENAATHSINTSLALDQLYKSVGLVKKVKKKAGAKKIAGPGGGGTKTPPVPGAKPPKKEKKVKDNVGTKILNTGIGLITAVKRFQLNYSQNGGKVLPGYLPDVGFIGTLKPSVGFIFGSQQDIRFEAAKQGWLTQFPNFNQQFTEIDNSQIDYNAGIDLIPDLTIDVVGNRNFSENFAENFEVRPNPISGELEYIPQIGNRFGNFGISTILIGTAFGKSDEEISQAFEDFKENRLLIAQRLALANGEPIDTNLDADGFPERFSKNNQAVLLPAFLAAYKGRDASKISLRTFRDVPLPNWTLKYTGLMRLKWFKKNFKRFSLAHGYRASYTINNFNANLDYQQQVRDNLDANGDPIVPGFRPINPVNDDFLNETLITNVNLVEQFNPLISFDMEMQNSIRILAELRKDRALSLSLDNNLLTETKGNEYVIGLGYRFSDVRFNTNLGGKKVTLKGDINLKADLSLRDNLTIIRNLDINSNQVTAGQNIWSIKFTADYALSKNLTTLFFYDHTFSKFAISTAFPQTTIRSGFTLRYNFGN
ncbi:cell surface protein SprA [Sungkyunkwania multivorans]|uniref:Cell surface protein SprA n=1 Tax=Sungkyunkwania multivorans TaxID=1173618 RepID=A0ABW3CT91_9FLAO